MTAPRYKRPLTQRLRNSALEDVFSRKRVCSVRCFKGPESRIVIALRRIRNKK